MARTLGQKQHFCRATMLGLVRLLCQPKLMGEGVLNLPDAWAIYRSLRETEGVDFCVDTESADATLAAWVSDASLRIPVIVTADSGGS